VNGARCEDLSNEVGGRAIGPPLIQVAFSIWQSNAGPRWSFLPHPPLTEVTKLTPPAAQTDCVNDMPGPKPPLGLMHGVNRSYHSNAAQRKTLASLNEASWLVW